MPAKIVSKPAVKRPNVPAPVAALVRPGRPVAAPAPAAPTRPGRPVAPRASAAEIVEQTTPRGRPAMPASGMSADERKELLAMIATLNANVKTLQAKAAKADAAASKTRTTTEIVTDGDKGIGKKDWRLPYHAATIAVSPFTFNNKGEMSVDTEQPPLNVLLAIPRSNDVGGGGIKARAANLLAVHWAYDPDSDSYVDEPSYVTQAQLGEMWRE